MYNLIRYTRLVYVNTEATIMLFFERIKLRKFVKTNPMYCFIYSKEANRRLREYIKDHDMRMKKIAAESMLDNIYGFHRIVTKYNLSDSEKQLMKELIHKIRNDLQIL